MKKLPAEAYSKVFTLVDRMERPVPVIALEWEVSHSEPDQYPELGDLDVRRGNLYTVLRDLSGQVLELTIHGIDIRENATPIEEVVGRLLAADLIST